MSPSASEPITIVHLAYTTFPADPRVKREALAASETGRVCVVALRARGQRTVERIGPLLVVRVPGRKSRGGPLSYVEEYVNFTLRCRRVLDHRRFARVRVVHVHTLPDFLVWAARPAVRRGARIVLDLHEIFPEFTAAKYPRATPLAVAIARAIERWARRSAAVTITVNEPIDALIGSRSIGRPERRIVIHNTADPAEFGPPRHTPRVAGGGPLELVYHGSLTPLYGLDLAIRGLALARARGVPASLAILSSNPHDRLATLAAELGVEAAVRFEVPLPFSALPERLSRCAAAVAPTRLDVMTRYSLSNKLLEYVHLGLPVLAARLPSYQQYLPEDTLWYWTPGDPADLARALADFAAAPQAERAARACRAQEAIAAVAWPRERVRLVTLYRELMHRP